jgi:prepilin-type N-terminal cleavage/methylation domain-containing protein
MLKKMCTQLRKKNKGFTLVELIVVIAILAILAAIAVPQLNGFQDRARQQADNQVAAQVKNAVGLLYANHELSFPDDADEDATFEVSGTGGAITVTEDDFGDLEQDATDIDGLLTDLIGDFNLQGDRIVQVTITVEGSVEAVLEDATP